VHLSFFVRYLVDRHRGRGPRGREFPPHPVRLQAALVNAWARGGKSPEEAALLEWLEALPPPWVLAPRADPEAWQAWVAFVPPHDAAEPPECRKKQPLVHHALPLPGRLLLYAYPLGGEAEEQARVHLPALRALAERVVYLGTSRNLVLLEVRLVADPFAVYQEEAGTDPWALVPAEEASAPGPVMRVAFPGFLRVTEERFRRGVRELPHRWVPYREAGGNGETQRPSPWGAWRVRALEPTLPLEWAPLLAHATRQALLSLLPPGAPSVLTGHGPDGASLRAPHLALVPLPNVGHPHADGRVLGLAFLLPPGVDPGAELALLEALLALEEVRLSRDLAVRLLPPDGRWTLREARWRGPARRYASVTPVVFDRYPKGGDVLSALRFSARAAGLPEPEAAWTLPYPRPRGVPLSRHFRLPPGVEGYVAHAELLFPEPVRGPVLLGRGRYLGLGFFLPMEVEGESPEDTP